jgi:ABC-type sugar transport system ATPase subunit
MPTLILKNLTRAYGSMRAVDNVSLVIKDGEFCRCSVHRVAARPRPCG